MHKNVVTLLISNHRAAKYVFKRVAQAGLEGGGWIYMHGSKSVSIADTIPHSLFTFSSCDLSEIISSAFSLCSRMEKKA